MATNKVRLYALTGAVAAITATGAWYGAGLNMRQEYKQEKAKVYEATPEEKVASLLNIRHQLVQSKEELQARIRKLESGDSSENVPAPSVKATTNVGMKGTLEGRTRTS